MIAAGDGSEVRLAEAMCSARVRFSTLTSASESAKRSRKILPGVDVVCVDALVQQVENRQMNPPLLFVGFGSWPPVRTVKETQPRFEAKPPREAIDVHLQIVLASFIFTTQIGKMKNDGNGLQYWEYGDAVCCLRS